MSDDRFLVVLAGYRGRFRAASMALAGLGASACAGAALAMTTLLAVPPVTARVVATVVFVIAAFALSTWAWRRWTPSRVASEIETRSRALDNLVITAEEIASGRAAPPHPIVRDELFTTVERRLADVPAESLRPLTRDVSVAALSVIATLVLLIAWPTSQTLRASRSGAVEEPTTASFAPGDIRVLVTPPAYLQQPVVEALNPTVVDVLATSVVRIEVMQSEGSVSLHEPDGRQTPFTTGPDRAVLELLATASRPLVVRHTQAGSVVSDRLVHLRVRDDARPVVQIREPAKDLMFPAGSGQVPVQIEARDDIALASVVLRYTRVSGSGETFTFEEGEWPVDIEREGVATWRARAVLALDRLKLQDGDTLVYRAVARDAKPGADPAASDTFLIEIGRLAGVASQGFALPEERDRQAISQQMLIIKTERLHGDRPKFTEEAFAEQARLLAVEQRMVKAEFVFMTGGEVEDEVEEATHAHELAEGRMENTGQAELLAAIREMSRAEARLNAADTARALESERAALKALQRAFDRRRYLLRTLPERARIDVSRRLTGELDTARSSQRPSDAIEGDPFVQNARALLRDLSRTPEQSEVPLLASRLLALGVPSEALQTAALQMTTARDEGARRAALRQAQQVLVSLLREQMATQARPLLQDEALLGRLVQELPSRRTP